MTDPNGAPRATRERLVGHEDEERRLHLLECSPVAAMVNIRMIAYLTV
jgi:hypothetical protein